MFLKPNPITQKAICKYLQMAFCVFCFVTKRVKIKVMQMTELCAGLLDALERFDTEILPLGLYASDDLVEAKQTKARYQEWQGAISPFLKMQGCSETGFYPYKNHLAVSVFEEPEVGWINLSVVKFSNIKVRKYGSGYHVDKHENRARRWEQIDLGGHISSLWKQQDSYSQPVQARIRLFIGFDKSQRVFERELNDLQGSLKWEQKGVHYQTRSWPDKASRGFGVRLAIWSKSIKG